MPCKTANQVFLYLSIENQLISIVAYVVQNNLKLKVVSKSFHAPLSLFVPVVMLELSSTLETRIVVPMLTNQLSPNNPPKK